MSNTQKNVELVIRARDESKRIVAAARTELERFNAAQRNTAQYRGLIQNQQLAAATARRLAIELRGVGLAASKDQVNGFRAARREARSATQQVEAFRRVQALGRGGGSAAGSFAAFDAIASGAVRADAAVDGATVAIQRNTAALKQNAAAGSLASRQAAAWGSRRGRGPLGLRPFELQNLSYQINDVFTQIASGTPIMQTAAQQGGQFVQLFPRAGGALLRFLPIIGLVSLALAPFASALKDVNDEADTLSEFDRLLMRSGEGASYTAAQLADLAQRLDEYGGSLKDARASLSEFVGDSVAPEYLERFGQTARDVAKVLKMDMADASKMVSDAFTGNADAVLALDDELNFLTDTERKHIEKLRESKRDAEARTQAFAIFERRYGETAAKMRGVWSQILGNFGRSWQAFVRYVNFIDFSKVKAEINGLMRLLARLSAMLPGAQDGTLPALEKRGRDLDAAILSTIDNLQRARAEGRNTSTFGAPSIGELERQYANQVRARSEVGQQISRLRRIDEERAENAANPPADTTLDPPAPANTDDGRDRDAERRVERQREFVAALTAENEARRFQVSLIGQQERAAKILEAIRKAEIDAAEVGLPLTEAQREAITQTVGALHDAEVAERARQAVARAALELAEKRGEIETRAAYIQRSLATEQLDLETELGRQRAEQLGDLWDIEDAARRRADAERAVNDLVSLRSDLLEQIQFYEDAGEQGTADRLREQLSSINQRLKEAIDHTIKLLGTMSGPQAEAARLKLEEIAATVDGVGEHIVVSGRQINEMLSEGGADALDRFAESIANGANAFQALRDSFLQFAADFLRKIAEMISQQAVLNALGAGADGSEGKGSTIAGWINGLFGGGSGFAPHEGGSWLQRLFPAIFRHNGGLAGQGGGIRSVPLAAYAGATRYHTGGFAGFKPNEVPAVLTRGEEVLTTRDPRHRANGGGPGGGSVKIVNVFDPAEAVERGLTTERGERVFMNFVRRNAEAFKTMLR